MSKALKLVVVDEELSQELEELIKAKLKNLLRNDDKIRKLIEETIEGEVKRRVGSTIFDFELKSMAEEQMIKRIDNIIAQGKFRVTQAVQDFITPLQEKSNEEVIKRMLVKHL